MHETKFQTPVSFFQLKNKSNLVEFQINVGESVPLDPCFHSRMSKGNWSTSYLAMCRLQAAPKVGHFSRKEREREKLMYNTAQSAFLNHKEESSNLQCAAVTINKIVKVKETLKCVCVILLKSRATYQFSKKLKF